MIVLDGTCPNLAIRCSRSLRFSEEPLLSGACSLIRGWCTRRHQWRISSDLDVSPVLQEHRYRRNGLLEVNEEEPLYQLTARAEATWE